MPGSDPKAVVQHDWVIEEWTENDGTIGFEHYCQACFQPFNFDLPNDEEYYSVCPEYDGDDDGEKTHAENCD